MNLKLLFKIEIFLQKNFLPFDFFFRKNLRIYEQNYEIIFDWFVKNSVIIFCFSFKNDRFIWLKNN